jgi:SGNH hydrolase-like domain, acetyltransferase AlgX
MGESALLEARGPSEVAAGQHRVRSRRARIGIVVLAAALTLVAFETVLAVVPRTLMPATLRTIQTFYTRRTEWRALTAGDPYLGFKLRPDVEVRFPFEGGAIPIRTTSHGQGAIGFRDIGTRAPFGAIVIGDSFVFCDEVTADGCWVRHLADATAVSMATLGVSGYSTLAEARVLRRYGPAFNAPLVLVGIFPNDLTDNVNFDRWARSGSDDLIVWLERERGLHGPGRWLEERSTAYRLLAAALQVRERAIHRHREGNLDLVLRFDDWWMRTVTAPDRHPGWPLMRDSLLDMRQAAAAMGAQLAVVIFPTKEEAYWDIARRYVPALQGVDANRLPRLLSRFLADHAISACDVTGELREQARHGHQLYHRVSGHFNEEGNRVAATAIGRCLASANLLGAPTR